MNGISTFSPSIVWLKNLNENFYTFFDPPHLMRGESEFIPKKFYLRADLQPQWVIESARLFVMWYMILHAVQSTWTAPQTSTYLITVYPIHPGIPTFHTLCSKLWSNNSHEINFISDMMEPQFSILSYAFRFSR